MFHIRKATLLGPNNYIVRAGVNNEYRKGSIFRKKNACFCMRPHWHTSCCQAALSGLVRRLAHIQLYRGWSMSGERAVQNPCEQKCPPGGIASSSSLSLLLFLLFPASIHSGGTETSSFFSFILLVFHTYKQLLWQHNVYQSLL